MTETLALVSARAMVAGRDEHTSKAPADRSGTEFAEFIRVSHLCIEAELAVGGSWNALTVNTDSEGELDYLVLGVDKDTLQNAPGFDKSSWPNMASPHWAEEIHAYYGQQDAWHRRQAQRREARPALESSSTPSTPIGQGDMSLSATVQTIREDKGLLRLRTAEGESVEFQVPQALAAELQTGDRVEVSIRKREGASPTSSSSKGKTSP